MSGSLRSLGSKSLVISVLSWLEPKGAHAKFGAKDVKVHAVLGYLYDPGPPANDL